MEETFKNITLTVYFISHYIPVKNRYPYSRSNQNNNKGINGQCCTPSLKFLIFGLCALGL